MNKRYKILIGEPWEFNAGNADNSISGEVIKIYDNKCALFKSDNKVSFREITSQYFIL